MPVAAYTHYRLTEPSTEFPLYRVTVAPLKWLSVNVVAVVDDVVITRRSPTFK